jgi:hypothetical protein
MKQGEKREKTGAKQGGNITAFRRINRRVYGLFQADKRVANWKENALI